MTMQVYMKMGPVRWPPSLEASATVDALRAICELDLSKLDSAEPPRGFWARLSRAVVSSWVRSRFIADGLQLREPIDKYPTLAWRSLRTLHRLAAASCCQSRSCAHRDCAAARRDTSRPF